MYLTLHRRWRVLLSILEQPPIPNALYFPWSWIPQQQIAVLQVESYQLGRGQHALLVNGAFDERSLWERDTGWTLTVVVV